MPKGQKPGYDEARKTVEYLTRRIRVKPRVGMILGSGLDAVAAKVSKAKTIPYASIPHFPRSTVAGHAGELYAGFWGDVPVSILAGRMHLYEGYTPSEVVFPARVLCLLGIEILVVTCAAGGIAQAATPGSFMILSDHLNYQGQNQLAGPHDERWGARFVDLSEAYDRDLRLKAIQAARSLRLKCREGVYVSLLGPSYETPAEIRALRRLGADAVGMSTVPEAIAARQMGTRVLGIATITNRAAGLSRTRLGHDEVLKIGKKSSEGLIRLLDKILKSI